MVSYYLISYMSYNKITFIFLMFWCISSQTKSFTQKSEINIEAFRDQFSLMM